MNAVLLAAGRGSRLEELTEHLPKCLVEIAGKPLLSWQLSALNTAGISKTVVVRGYGKEHLIGGEYSVVDNERWAQTNMVSTLICAGEILKEGAVVSYTDIVYHPTIVESLLNNNADIAITYDRLWLDLWSSRFDNPLEDAETFNAINDQVTTIGDRPDSIEQIKGQFMGLIKFSPRGWRQTENFLQNLPHPEVDQLDMTELLNRLVQDGVFIGAVAIDGRWCEIDTQSDLTLYKKRIAEQDSPHFKWSHDWRW